MRWFLVERLAQQSVQILLICAALLRSERLLGFAVRIENQGVFRRIKASARQVNPSHASRKERMKRSKRNHVLLSLEHRFDRPANRPASFDASGYLGNDEGRVFQGTGPVAVFNKCDGRV